MGLNQVKVLHEATQLAFKGHKVLVSCPCVDPELAEKLIERVDGTLFLYDARMQCTK